MKHGPVSDPVRVVAFTLALALGACGGANDAAPQPLPSPSGGPTLTTALRAARGTEQAAFAVLHAQVLIAQFARPGRGPLVPAAAPAPPACDPSGSATANATASDVAGQFYYTTFAFYPPGDAACAQAPLALGVIAYPNPATAPKPLVAQGYLAAWAPANDPYYKPGAPFEFDQFTLTTDGAPDGQAHMALSFTGSDGYYASGSFPQRPGAGSFPGTFPVVLPKTIASFQAQIGFSTALSLAEQGQALSSTVVVQPAGLLSGTASYVPDGYVVGATSSNTLLGQVAQALSAAPAPDGTGVAFGGAAVPAYAYSSAAPVALSGFPPGANAAFGFQPGPAIAPSVGPVNFPAARQQAGGTFSYGGVPSGVDEKFVDAANQVAVEIVSGSGGYALTVTDLISGKPMTTPAVVPVDSFGNASPYAFVFDGTSGVVRAFTVVE